MNVFKQLKQFYWNDRKYLFWQIAFLTLATALGLVYPNLLRYLIDDVISKGAYGKVAGLALLVVLVVSIKGSFTFLQGYFGGRLGNRVAYNMRNALYDKLQVLSFQYYDKARTGDLMSRLTADLEAMRQFIGFGFAQLLNVGMMFLFGMIMMLSINWQLTLMTLIAMPFLAVAAIRFEGKIHPAFRNVRRAMSDLTTAVQENITGVRTVKSFAREPHEIDKFSRRSDDYRDTNVASSAIWASYFPAMELLANISLIVLLGAGGYMVIHDRMTTGELVAFFSMIYYIISPLWGIGFQINNYTQSKAAGERILDILHQYLHVKDKENAKDFPNGEMKGHVRFEDVTYAYSEQPPSLTHFTLDAPPGTVIGLLGGTGAGKSTVIQLLMRAYNVKEGKVTIDGINIQDLKLEPLRRQIATVFQETFLFSSSIRNNIAYGDRDISMDAIVKAAKLAKAHDFIMELPEGYDTIVGERGMGLSGGQKQRIAIARALLKDPRILILDDATSAVDMETEHEIQAGFRELMAGRTTFIIAHRISSLRHADEIIVLDKGKVVQRGSHEQLLKQQGPYLETYKIQYADRPVDTEESGAEEQPDIADERVVSFEQRLQERRLAN